MLERRNSKDLAHQAVTLASGHNLVRYRNTTYVPADFETRAYDVPPDADRTIWLPLSRLDLQQMAKHMFSTIFGNDGELASFDFMVSQVATLQAEVIEELLVRTHEGLRRLTADGQLEAPTGEFVPNTLVPMLNEDEAVKAHVFSVVEEWLDSAEEAESLLSHLATCLSPGYSAVKYVLLLGEGRNGKSVLLKMLQALFGFDNVSTVTRQQISEQSPVVCELNGKLLNIVMDGRAEYLKDSGTEKSLIAGEPVPIRRLYESTPTMVLTNALFVEGLNREPKSNDKSSALQKRLVRFQFPNVYPLNHKFEREMLKEETLGAFLSLLIDRYVPEDDVATRLAPTTKALELQLEHMYINSLGLQFLKYVEDTDPLGVAGLFGETPTELAKRFCSWRIHENDLGAWSEPDVLTMLSPLIHTDRKSVRVDGAPRKIRVVSSLKPEAQAFIESLKGEEEDEALIHALVED